MLINSYGFDYNFLFHISFRVISIGLDNVSQWPPVHPRGSACPLPLTILPAETRGVTLKFFHCRDSKRLSKSKQKININTQTNLSHDRTLPLSKRRVWVVQHFCPFFVPHNVFWRRGPELRRVVYRPGKCIVVDLSTVGRVLTCMHGTSNTSQRSQTTQVGLRKGCQSSETSIYWMHVYVSKVQCPEKLRKPSCY